MPHQSTKLLVVDGNAASRTSLTLIFSELGYSVRSAADGCSALVEIRNEIPDVLLADLNMARISGVEFLMVVRRWLPSIRVIAMAMVSPENRVPAGVAADAIFRKGAGPVRLIKVIDSMTQPKRSTCRLGLANSQGFRGIEAIPSRPRNEQLAFPVSRTVAFHAPQGEQSDEISAMPNVTQTQAVSF